MSAVLTLPENKTGRDFVVGDIHGSFDLLDAALQAVSFDKTKDRLICVGDLINRGARSRDCLDYLAQPWFFSIRGNHEQIFLKAIKSGKMTEPGIVDKIAVGFRWVFNESASMWAKMQAAFEKMPIAIEIETPQGPVGFVHANVPKDMDWQTFKAKLLADDKETRDYALWNRDRIYNADPSGVTGVLRVYLGHTTVPDHPRMLGNCCFMDTGAVYKEIGENDTDDLFLSIIEVGADVADILAPVKTQNKLVRTVTVRKPTP